MARGKQTRSKTTAMAQSVTAQSHSSHNPAIDMMASPSYAAMNPQQNLAAAQQPPPCVAGTTVSPIGPATRTTALVPATVIPRATPPCDGI
ncbi:unnamed protein product [Prunus armeniaca]